MAGTPLKSLSAEEIIKELRMQPHPEGGYYVETFRDVLTDTFGRSASTAIYFLLSAGVVSAWHKVDAIEIWHWYAGSPLKLSISPDGTSQTDVMLGPDIPGGERPQAIVPREGWQQAQSLGDWTLVGCTVAPGFQFEGLVMAPDGWAPGNG